MEGIMYFGIWQLTQSWVETLHMLMATPFRVRPFGEWQLTQTLS
jgi:hypothetical protein